MPPAEFRANDSAYDLTLPVGQPEADPAGAELARMRQIIHDLRNPVGSMSMAVEMLLGPLKAAISAMEPELGRRVGSTLEAMGESARQMRHLVSDLSGLAQGSRELVPGGPASGPQLVAIEAQVPAPPIRPRASRLEVADLLRRLEILTVTRSALPALLAVDVEPGLYVDANGPELLRALSNLVENGIEASARSGEGEGPWTVDVRAHGRANEVRIEIHNRGPALPEAASAFLTADPAEVPATPPPSSKTGEGLHGVGLGVVRRVADAYGARVTACSAAGVTVVAMVLPRAAAPEAPAELEPAPAAPEAPVRPALAVI